MIVYQTEGIGITVLPVITIFLQLQSILGILIEVFGDVYK